MSEDLAWLAGYEGQDTETLLALAASHRVDSIVLAFEQALQDKEQRHGSTALNETEATVLTVVAMEREVNNGGFHQFFMNAPQYAHAASAACERIACPASARIAREAWQQLGLAPGASPSEVELAAARDDGGSLMARLSKESDAAFFQSGDALAQHVFDYLSQHRAQVVLPAR